MSISKFSNLSIALGLEKTTELWDEINVSPVLAGYVTAGNIQTDDLSSAFVQKFVFSNETISQLRSSLLESRVSTCGTCNQGIAGYTYGGSGFNNNYLNGIDKLNLWTETTNTLSAVLTRAKDNQFATGNPVTAGYVFGGFQSGGSTSLSEIDKLLYSTETKSTISATYQNRGGQGMTNYDTAGYIPGGYTGSAYTSDTRKLTYSNETMSSNLASLDAAKIINGCFPNHTTAGYIYGGTTNTSTIRKHLFSNDTQSTLSITTSWGGAYGYAGMHHAGTAGYAAGGDATTIMKVNFSNDTSSSVTATLLFGIYNGTGTYSNAGTP
jgi:hypothetical protein